MEKIVTYIILIAIFGSIFSIICYANRKKLDNLMKSENPKYSGYPNNFIDIVRIVQVLRNSKSLNHNDKRFLTLYIISFGISLITFFAILFMMIYFL